MSIRTKVVGCFLVILLSFACVAVWSYFRSARSSERLASVNELFLPLSRQVAQLQSNVQGMADDIRRFYFKSAVSSENSTFSRMVRDVYPYAIHQKFANIDQLLAKQDNPQVHEMVTELTLKFAQAGGVFDEMMQAHERDGFNKNYVELRQRLEVIAHRLENECQRITLAAQDESKENLICSVFMTGAIVLFGILTVLLSHRALSPLPQLIQSLKKIADGDFNQDLKVKASDQDEIALLAREYNRMLKALAARDREIHRQQFELMQSTRLAAVGQLSAEVVHEIRNPLNSISLNIDWLQSELPGADDEVGKTLASIAREIARLHQITESYLVRSRAPFAESERTPVNELIQEILDFTREEDRASQIAVEANLSSQELYVRTERSRLKQAFLNVMRNAREAMPRGGRLKIETEIVDNVYRIAISDSGYGMNETTRRQTFRPFFTTKPNGTGLGLMLTKSIVEEAQGSVHCESHLGSGTTFTFRFPV